MINKIFIQTSNCNCFQFFKFLFWKFSTVFSNSRNLIFRNLAVQFISFSNAPQNARFENFKRLFFENVTVFKIYLFNGYLRIFFKNHKTVSQKS